MKSVYIIAEAGVNHNGDIEMAKELITTAAEAGADAIKFQHFNPQQLVCAATPTSSYQRRDTNSQNDQRSMLEALALSDDQQRDLQSYARKLRIDYLCTPFDTAALEFIIGLEPRYLKFSSGDLTNIPLLLRAVEAKIPLILSTGMATTEEIATTLSHLQDAEIHLLHCVSAYPTPLDQLNLQSINYLRRHFNLPVGFSDHTLGTTAAVAAVACGAHIVEKHLTLDPELPGPDHQASADPATFLRLVTRIRETEKMLGKPQKVVQSTEEENRELGRRSLVLNQPLRSGEIIETQHLTAKRPAGGIAPTEWSELIGKKANCDIAADTPLQWEWVE